MIENNPVKFDWNQCIGAFGTEHRDKLATWRGYSGGLVDWLCVNRLIGLFDGDRIAFPVHDAQGNVVGTHFRLKEDGTWRYFPYGTRTALLVVGATATAKTVLVFESQWDMFAVLEKLQHHVQPLLDTAFVATRGASNGRLLAGLCASNAILYAFGQNDAAGETWLNTIAAHCGCECLKVTTPSPFKDANDWTKAGATRVEIEAAIGAAQSLVTSKEPDIADETDELESAAFPIDCLPLVMACMVRAVATTHRVPESMPGLMALALVAASIGKGLVLDWRPGKAPTPANVFALLSASSGTGKSECAKQLSAPLFDFETDMQEGWRKTTMPKLQADLRFHESQLKKIDRRLAKDSISLEDAEHLRAEQVFHQEQTEELKAKLHEPKLCIQDATVERVATVLQQNDETICSLSSDARKLVDNLLGRYAANKKLADDGIYLCAYSGDHVTVDRQGRDGVRLVNPNLTLLWALQPDALEMLMDEDSLQQGGFLARCLIAHTQAEPQHIGGDIAVVSEDVRRSWERLIRDLIITYRQPPLIPEVKIETIDEEI